MVRLRYLALARLTRLKIALSKSQEKAKISFALLKTAIILLKYSFFAPLKLIFHTCGLNLADFKKAL